MPRRELVILGIPRSWLDVPFGVPSLDADGKISPSALPDIAISQVFVVASEAAMLALDAQIGDVAKRTDLQPNQSFMLSAEPPSTLANWIKISDIAIDFTTLLDTPNNYTGAAKKIVIVNSTPDGLEFTTVIEPTQVIIDGTALTTQNALQISLDSDVMTTGEAIKILSGPSSDQAILVADEDGNFQLRNWDLATVGSPYKLSPKLELTGHNWDDFDEQSYPRTGLIQLDVTPGNPNGIFMFDLGLGTEGYIYPAAASTSYYGGKTAGKALFFRANIADAYPFFGLTGGANISFDVGAGNNIIYNEAGAPFLTFNKSGSSLISDADTGHALKIEGNFITTGAGLIITADSDIMTTGKILDLLSGPASNVSVFSVDKDGNVIGAGDINIGSNKFIGVVPWDTALIYTGTNPGEIYGGDTAGDDLFLYPNTVDAADPFIQLAGGSNITLNLTGTNRVRIIHGGTPTVDFRPTQLIIGANADAQNVSLRLNPDRPIYFDGSFQSKSLLYNSTTGEFEFNDVLSMGTHKISDVATPTADADAATKAYVDQLAQGLDWQESVKDKDLTAPPGGESVGDRYIVGASATGDWAGHDFKIAEVTSISPTVWEFTTPDEGTACFVEDEDTAYIYNAPWDSTNHWVKLSSIHNHNDLANIGSSDHHTRPVQATESVLGIAEIATQAETDAGTDDSRFITPLKLANMPPSRALTPIISPAALTGNVNDWNPTGLSTAQVIRCDPGTGNREITGIVAQENGARIYLLNISTANDIKLKNENTSSAAANRFILKADLTLEKNEGVCLIYDGTTQRWRVASTNI